MVIGKRQRTGAVQNASRIRGRFEWAPAFGLRQSSGALGRTLLPRPYVLVRNGVQEHGLRLAPIAQILVALERQLRPTIKKKETGRQPGLCEWMLKN